MNDDEFDPTHAPDLSADAFSELIGSVTPIVPRITPQLGCPHVGGNSSTLDPLTEWTSWDRDDWDAGGRDDFNEALQARADAVGYEVACSEVAKVALKHLRSVSLRVDAHQRRGRNDVIEHWHEQERARIAARTIGAMQGDRREIAMTMLAKLEVPLEEQLSILKAWRALHGVPEHLLLDDHAQYRAAWPGTDELAEIVAHRRRATKPSQPPPSRGKKAK